MPVTTPTSLALFFRRLVSAAPWALASVAILLLAGTVAQARPLDEVVESGTLRIAVYRDFPPFSYDDDGELHGIDVDLGKHIAEALRVRPSFMVITADENVDDDLRNAVWQGHYLRREVADLMLHVPVDRRLDLRNTLVAISSPYFRREIVLAYDSERVGADPEPLAFVDMPIGVELDSLPDFFLSSAYGGQIRGSVVHFPDVGAAAEALRRGDVAGVMAPRSQIEAGLGEAVERFQIVPVSMDGFARTTWLVGLAVNEDSRDLSYAVGDIIAAGIENGVIPRIFSTHGISYRPPYED